MSVCEAVIVIYSDYAAPFELVAILITLKKHFYYKNYVCNLLLRFVGVALVSYELLRRK